jgi:hypothetical protein
LGKEGSKKVPCIIFVGLKMVFSKTAPKWLQKKYKTLLKKSAFIVPTDVLYFFKIFHWFCPLSGPLSWPLRIFKLLICRFSSQYTYKQLAKGRTEISSKLELLKISNYRRHIFAGSALMGWGVLYE